LPAGLQIDGRVQAECGRHLLEATSRGRSAQKSRG
jgi:hypothetical protein